MAQQHSLLNSNFPVWLPEMPELHLNKLEFDAYVKLLLTPDNNAAKPAVRAKDEQHSKFFPSNDKNMKKSAETAFEPHASSKFMTGLLNCGDAVSSFDKRDGKMLTQNQDVTYRTSGRAVVDLFSELEDVVHAYRLEPLLEDSWKEDAEATLKIIWNARSIHLGKGSRNAFYRAIGWLAEKHPLTLITNLAWLVRPVIQKKAPNKDEADIEMVDARDAEEEFEIVDQKGRSTKPEYDHELSAFDVKYGVAHGYWKDLLNILALAANGELTVYGQPRKVLNIEKPKGDKRFRNWSAGRKAAQTRQQHARIYKKLESDPFYKALHLTVTRLFAEQLEIDMAHLASKDKKEMKLVTQAAKWAPSNKGMHDNNTFIVTSIAEALHPFHKVCQEPADRMTYLKHARIAYQSQTLSPLRRQLEIVERPITAQDFDKINYERVPSLAMKQYTPLFATKDFDRFDKYVDNVSAGKAKISGAVLLPGALVHSVFALSIKHPSRMGPARTHHASKQPKLGIQQKIQEIHLKATNGQWNTLVRRIKDSGTLESSIAVCDTSGSMSSPKFRDGTCPMEHAIGLSLLVAEVCKPPFGGAFITFDRQPRVLQAGGTQDPRTFVEKVDYIRRAPWGANTNFGAVFDLLLDMARKHRLKQADMVKQVFVFSDMQFDQARSAAEKWSTSFERIQGKFRRAGYQMPRLIFWNLAGEMAGMLDGGRAKGYGVAPKPVLATEEGTVLVSGYSQGQMKMFLESSSFEEPKKEDEEEEAVMVENEVKGEGGETVLDKKRERENPLDAVRKAIGHEAYRMLKVVD